MAKSSYSKRIEERDEARRQLLSLQKKVWKLRQGALYGTGEGTEISPFMEMEGNEEGPRLNEEQLRQAIMEIKIWL